jgi:2-polyprenyl-3-methyl-5-hydroxy-6-metoxy-1,4-benzoquinol methylase
LDGIVPKVGKAFCMATIAGYYTQERKEMAVFLPETYSSVLEIGCGEGSFSANLKPRCEIWGIEPNNVAAETASHKMHRVLVGRYDEVVSQLPDDYFDLVICNDVIEHMEDHDAFFDSIRRKMKRDAYLVGSIPNVRYFSNLGNLLLKRDWKYADEGVVDRTHLRFFTEISFKRTLQQHGFSIEGFEGINRLGFDVFSMKNILQWVAVYCAIAVTLGWCIDICFLQFGFRARKCSPFNQ